MRLSDVKGERAIEVVADIIEPIYRIAQDEAAIDVFRPKECPEGTDPKAFMAARMAKGVPALLRGHKADLIAILAAIEGADPDEYAESLDLAKLTASLVEMVTDPALLGFLASSAPDSEPTRGE